MLVWFALRVLCSATKTLYMTSNKHNRSQLLEIPIMSIPTPSFLKIRIFSLIVFSFVFCFFVGFVKDAFAESGSQYYKPPVIGEYYIYYDSGGDRNIEVYLAIDVEAYGGRYNSLPSTASGPKCLTVNSLQDMATYKFSRLLTRCYNDFYDPDAWGGDGGWFKQEMAVTLNSRAIVTIPVA